MEPVSDHRVGDLDITLYYDLHWKIHKNDRFDSFFGVERHTLSQSSAHSGGPSITFI